MSRLIQKALEETLKEIDEETRDLALARERLADADFISQEQYDRYLARRLRR